MGSRKEDIWGLGREEEREGGREGERREGEGGGERGGGRKGGRKEVEVKRGGMSRRIFEGRKHVKRRMR